MEHPTENIHKLQRLKVKTINYIVAVITNVPYLIKVLTLATSISYSFFTAARTWCLLAQVCTMNTNVLLSSIFFIAASVVNGNLMILNASILQNDQNIFDQIKWVNYAKVLHTYTHT